MPAYDVNAGSQDGIIPVGAVGRAVSSMKKWGNFGDYGVRYAVANADAHKTFFVNFCMKD